MRKIKATLKVLVRMGVSAGLLAWLLLRSDPSQVLHALSSLSVAAWLAAFVLYIFSQLVSSYRWRVISTALGFGGTWTTYLGYYFVGMYFNLFLPTGVGGDFLKAMFLVRERPRKLRATLSVLADRLFGLGAMFLLGGGAVTIWPGLLPRRFTLVLQAAALGTLVIPFTVWAVRKISDPGDGRFRELLLLFERPGPPAKALALSLVLQSLGMGAVALLAWDMGLSPPPQFYFAAFPLVALLVILPISFNGIGVREGGFIYFLGLKGVGAERALTLSLAFFAVQVLASLIGGMGYTMGLHKAHLSQVARDD